jgi:hypothetical protein
MNSIEEMIQEQVVLPKGAEFTEAIMKTARKDTSVVNEAIVLICSPWLIILRLVGETRPPLYIPPQAGLHPALGLPSFLPRAELIHHQG